MTIHLFQRGECQICLEDPFEIDRCLPKVPIDTKFLQCYSCKYTFPHGQRSSITLTKEGKLISEKLEPSIEGMSRVERVANCVMLSALGILLAMAIVIYEIGTFAGAIAITARRMPTNQPY